VHGQGTAPREIARRRQRQHPTRAAQTSGVNVIDATNCLHPQRLECCCLVLLDVRCRDDDRHSQRTQAAQKSVERCAWGSPQDVRIVAL
jgi:hypothetical protein